MAKRARNALVKRVSAGTSHVDEHDSEWRKIGLGAPARRALVDAKLYRVSDLRRMTRAELAALHGMGKSTIARLLVIMDAKKMAFRDE
jgi:hypothetical protein